MFHIHIFTRNVVGAPASVRPASPVRALLGLHGQVSKAGSAESP